MQLQDLLPGVPIVESPLFEQVAATEDWDAETVRIARELHEKGFAVLDFPDPDFDDMAERIKARLHDRYDWSEWRNQGWSSNRGMRLQDIWPSDPDVKSIACNERILSLLSTIYGRRAWPFQTLNFPVGTQQHAHSDSVHFSTVPERFTCGVWVALEDIGPDAGPLVYCPGSHRWPILYNELIGVRAATSKKPINQGLYEETWQALVDAAKLQMQTFTPKKGQALIWAANLLHGGSRQKNAQATRWSQVTHYFFDDCCYITPMFSNVFLGDLAVRHLTDISTGKEMPNVYLDTKLADERSNSKGQVAAAMDWIKAKVGFGMPSDFNPQRYLVLNPDVQAANVDPKQHYIRHGRREKRRYA